MEPLEHEAYVTDMRQGERAATGSVLARALY